MIVMCLQPYIYFCYSEFAKDILVSAKKVCTRHWPVQERFWANGQWSVCVISQTCPWVKSRKASYKLIQPVPGGISKDTPSPFPCSSLLSLSWPMPTSPFPRPQGTCESQQFILAENGKGLASWFGRPETCSAL